MIHWWHSLSPFAASFASFSVLHRVDGLSGSLTESRWLILLPWECWHQRRRTSKVSIGMVFFCLLWLVEKIEQSIGAVARYGRAQLSLVTLSRFIGLLLVSVRHLRLLARASKPLWNSSTGHILTGVLLNKMRALDACHKFIELKLTKHWRIPLSLYECCAWPPLWKQLGVNTERWSTRSNAIVRITIIASPLRQSFFW